MMRRSTRNFKLGNLGIGSEYPVSIQSMTTIPVSDVEGNLAQIGRLYSVGCDIVRLAFDRAEEAVFLRLRIYLHQYRLQLSLYPSETRE